MIKSKILIVVVLFPLLVLAVTPVWAVATPSARLGQLRERIASRPGILRAFLGSWAAIGSGDLTTKDGTTLTVTKDGKTYTIHTDDKTVFRRKFWGKSSLDELNIGDRLNVIGIWEDEAKTTVKARFIRDVSIQKRHGVFFGTVKSTSGTGFVMDSVARGTQTVTVGVTTKYVNRRGQTITLADILVGHKVRVRGLWDSHNSTITEVTHVKDFSLPTRPTPSPSP